MPLTQETNISSFLLRFIDVTQPVDKVEPVYRGVIRHIQTGEELAFTRWMEAMEFIHHYFPVEDLDPRINSET